MQGILKSNHQKLCEYLQGVKEMHLVSDHNLNELEQEFNAAFRSYHEMMQELKKIINTYEEKERLLKNEIKRIRKFNGEVSKMK